MDKVFQVFVSSTFTDLEAERKQVSDTLAKAGFIPAGMELFPATDQKQLEFIKRIIDRCDYYVVIVAGKYGSLDGDKSFTEKEYEYAVSKSLPVLAFIHKEPGKIPFEKADRDAKQIERLEIFRTRLKSSRIVAFWADVHELRTEVLTAVTNSVNLSPGIGWVRGDQAIDPRIAQELERIRLENAELKARLLAESHAEITFPANLAQPTDDFTFRLETISYTDDPHVPARRNESERDENPVTVKIGEMFVEIFARLLVVPTEASLRSIIGAAVAKISLAQSPSRAMEFRVALSDVEKMRFHLEALGLIFATAQGSQFNRIAWEITDKGRRYVTQIRGIPRPA